MAEKRRASGRKSRDAKRARTSTTKAPTPKAATPATPATPVQEVAPVDSPRREATPLPNKVYETKPLPTLSEAQKVDLSDEEYRSIAESGVLLASLERSRQKWISGTFLDKYWTKTSGRKDAPPPPPNNPHRTWMKEVGPCTIVAEPLILEASVFFVKEPGAPPLPTMAYTPVPGQPQPQPQPQPIPIKQQPRQQQPHHQHHQQTPFQHQPYHPSPQQYHPQHQQHTPHQRPQPIAHGQPPNTTGSPYGAPYSTPSAQYQSRPPNYPHPSHQPTPIMPATARAPPPPQPPPPAKQSPDPVIQMLASRASSDPELKALMKIVATGNANQDQLRIFQRHIDELTAMINANKAQAQPPISQAPSPASSYGHHPPSRPPSTAPIHPHPSTPSQRPPIYPMPHQKPTVQYSHPPPPPQYPCYPIVIEFQGPGASPDRYRFPAHTILEFLTPLSVLASFLVIRKGSDIGPHLEPHIEYYEPVTVKITVPEIRSAAKDVLQYINRSLKPANEVRAWMTEKVEKCTRAPKRHLALRLPHKSGIVEVEEEEVVPEVKPKPKPVPRKKKEGKEAEQATTTEAAKAGAEGAQTGNGQAPPSAPEQVPQQDVVMTGTGPENAVPSNNVQAGTSQTEQPQQEAGNTDVSPAQVAEAPTTSDTAPSLSRKKSVRISEADTEAATATDTTSTTTTTDP